MCIHNGLLVLVLALLVLLVLVVVVVLVKKPMKKPQPTFQKGIQSYEGQDLFRPRHGHSRGAGHGRPGCGRWRGPRSPSSCSSCPSPSGRTQRPSRCSPRRTRLRGAGPLHGTAPPARLLLKMPPHARGTPRQSQTRARPRPRLPRPARPQQASPAPHTSRPRPHAHTAPPHRSRASHAHTQARCCPPYSASPKQSEKREGERETFTPSVVFFSSE